VSISRLIPRQEAEMALLEELRKEGKLSGTGKSVGEAIKHFPQLTPAELQRRTPSGTIFWPGRFRFDLDHLKKRGYATNPVKGFWEITDLGTEQLKGSQPQLLADRGQEAQI
jgi:restriction endonuclease Mrr